MPTASARSAARPCLAHVHLPYVQKQFAQPRPAELLTYSLKPSRIVVIFAQTEQNMCISLIQSKSLNFHLCGHTVELVRAQPKLKNEGTKKDALDVMKHDGMANAKVNASASSRRSMASESILKISLCLRIQTNIIHFAQLPASNYRKFRSTG